MAAKVVTVSGFWFLVFPARLGHSGGGYQQHNPGLTVVATLRSSPGLLLSIGSLFTFDF
jgi:hypothetical protein